MSAEEEISKAVGGLESAFIDAPLRHAIPMNADTESRLVALERNIMALHRGLLRAGAQIEDLRKRLGAA
jgi:hypothetical protein